jgi:outer membrane protein OmpA-like peptidoglycan-associated protein/5-hydroxyisourate hydrolase-like protein (transthyretin family)
MEMAEANQKYFILFKREASKIKHIKLLASHQIKIYFKMKKIIIIAILLCNMLHVFAQSTSSKKPSTINLHFFYNDFNTSVFNNPNTMFGGWGADYLKGITKKIDAVGTFNGSWVNYVLPTNIPFGSNHFLLDVNAGAHFKMFEDKCTFNPFIITKMGYTKYQSIGGFSALLGGGLQVNVFKNTFVFSSMEYRKAISPSISNQLYYSIGIASAFGKPSTKKVKAKTIAITVNDEATGQPLRNVEVTLKNNAGDVFTATTNTDGKAIFNEIKTGNYTVNGRLNKIDATTKNIIDADFKNGGNQIAVTLTHNDPRFTLVGNTVDKKANAPVGGTQVTVTNTTQSSTSFTTSNAASGEFAIQLEGGSTFDIVGKKASYISSIENVSTVGLNRSTTLYLKLQLDIEEAKVGQNIVLNKIYFETGSASLETKTSEDLRKLIQFLIDNPSIKLEIQGHTDNVGNLQSNMDLSQQRASNVVTYLVSKGIDKSRLTAKGYGPNKPIANNNTIDGKAQNRRVEIKIIE